VNVIETIRMSAANFLFLVWTLSFLCVIVTSQQIVVNTSAPVGELRHFWKSTGFW